MVSRRGFLTGMLALGVAPAIVRAASLMPVVTPAGLIVPEPGVVTLDALRKVSRKMQDARGVDGSYTVFCHPSWEDALREQIITGTATVLYRGEVSHYG